jgi:hypothetical protein
MHAGNKKAIAIHFHGALLGRYLAKKSRIPRLPSAIAIRMSAAAVGPYAPVKPNMRSPGESSASRLRANTVTTGSHISHDIPYAKIMNAMTGYRPTKPLTLLGRL